MQNSSYFLLSIAMLLFASANLNAIEQKFVCYVIGPDKSIISASALPVNVDAPVIINKLTEPSYSRGSASAAVREIFSHCHKNLDFKKYDLKKPSQKKFAIYTADNKKLIYSSDILTSESKI